MTPVPAPIPSHVEISGLVCTQLIDLREAPWVEQGAQIEMGLAIADNLIDPQNMPFITLKIYGKATCPQFVSEFAV